MTTGMGHANAASSTMALVFSKQFDLQKTYFLVAGIAGIDPSRGTLGSAAWAKYLVEFGAQWEMDSREKPSDWPSGFVAVGSKTPDALPTIENQTEVFELNSDLADAGFALSRDIALADSVEAKATRANFTYAPANQPPLVLQCDTLSDDTWWAGDLIGERARTWMKQITHGKGTYCTSQQEDNATFEALKRAADADRLDIRRVAVLRSGSDFDRPYKGQSASESLFSFQSAGGFAPAIENVYRAGYPLTTNIVDHWSAWVDGVPAKLPAQKK
jgi:purine nucleoside permease